MAALHRRLEVFVVQFLAFPMRLGENGLLRRQERATALMSLLQMMARTPQGSWQA